MEKRGRLFGLVVLVAFFWLLASTGEAAIIDVHCESGGILQTSITAAASGDTIRVSGTCIENVVVNKSVIIDGSGIPSTGTPTAEIHATDAGTATVKITSGGVTFRNFHSIQGGQDGISVSACGPTIFQNTIQTNGRDGIFVSEGTGPIINLNNIHNNGRFGIDLYAGSFATIINNTITSNTDDGIYISENSAGRIGFSSGSDTVASPNTITNNGGLGIYVYQSSNARIVGNTISDNAGDGIAVARLSHADIAKNTINHNTGNGIVVSGNSVVNLGNSGSGLTIFDLPNITTVNNIKWGIVSSAGALVVGRLGTLDGDLGAILSSGIGITTFSLSDAVDESGIDVNGNINITGTIIIR